MSTTREQISDWFDRAADRAADARYMLIVCDTFDHEDYPVYEKDRPAAQHKAENPGSMQRVMEVYDLTKDKEEQLDKRRCWALA